MTKSSSIREKDAARVVIIEDDPSLMQNFAEIVEGCEELELICQAANLAEARDCFDDPPELFLLDIGLPDGSGLDLIPEIKDCSDAAILIITSFGDPDTVIRALRIGANGYLLKDTEPDELLQSILVTLDGGAPISSSVAIYLLKQVRGEQPALRDDDIDDLSIREAEVLRILAQGSTYKEVAESLGISPLTVGQHVKAIYSKLAVTSRSEAIYEAVKAGQISL